MEATMRIVKEGKLIAWWAGRKPVCLTCKTKAELGAADIPFRSENDRHDGHHLAVFPCKNCGADITVIKR